MLKPVKQRKISDQIYEQIRDLIYRGEYKPGEQLIAERELAILFKVGRPTVRTAIQKLIDNGLIVVKHGVGTFVAEDIACRESSPLLQILSEEEFTITEFQETRMALEIKSAELASQRATDDDLRLLDKSLIRLREDLELDRINMNSNISFHMNIAYASKNIVHIQLMKSIYEVQYAIMKLSYAKLFRSLSIDALIYQQHADIAAAIARRDPIQASKAMEEHISGILNACREGGL
jgi:GntR family transcriptional repressor for pyruvate dehydrogenase complex